MGSRFSMPKAFPFNEGSSDGSSPYMGNARGLQGFWLSGYGDVHRRSLEVFLNCPGADGDQEAPLPSVDVNEGQRKDRRLNVHGQRGAGPERADPADSISCVPMGGSRITRGHMLDAEDPRQLFCGDLAVTVHQDNERLARVCLEHQGLYHVVFGNLQLRRRTPRAAMFFVFIKVRFEWNGVNRQVSNCSSGGNFGSCHKGLLILITSSRESSDALRAPAPILHRRRRQCPGWNAGQARAER